MTASPYGTRPHAESRPLIRFSQAGATRIASTKNASSVASFRRAPLNRQDSLDAAEEFELQKMASYIKLGESAFDDKEYVKAETWLAKACAQPKLLARFSNEPKRKNVTHKLAIAVLRQGRPIETIEICKTVLQMQSLNTDEDRLLVLSVALTSAQALLLQEDLE